jgi:hypothetical protein
LKSARKGAERAKVIAEAYRESRQGSQTEDHGVSAYPPASKSLDTPSSILRPTFQ